MERLRQMSQEERRAYIQQLNPAERRRIFEQFRAAREQEQAADRSNPARPKPAFVFQEDASGALTVLPITIGLSSWEYTEVLQGLEEGEAVTEVPLALIQQRELLERIRGRSGVPGVQRN